MSRVVQTDGKRISWKLQTVFLSLQRPIFFVTDRSSYTSTYQEERYTAIFFSSCVRIGLAQKERTNPLIRKSLALCWAIGISWKNGWSGSSSQARIKLFQCNHCSSSYTRQSCSGIVVFDGKDKLQRPDGQINIRVVLLDK